MGTERQYCTFRVGSLSFGVDVLEVQEVIHRQEMTRVPRASTVVRGLTNLRGQIVMAIDLGRRIGLEPRGEEGESINVIIKAGERPVSLVVDEVGDILNLRDEDRESPPDTLPNSVRSLVTGIHQLEERLLLILDASRVVDFDAAA